MRRLLGGWLLLGSSLWACTCASPNSNLLYRCELDGGCLSVNFVCATAPDPDQGYCVPVDGGAGGGGAGGGGAGGGGIGGGGTAGDGGGCRTCADLPAGTCQELDDGCGHTLRCDTCPGDSFCNVAGSCDNKVCTPQGWCWETPWPQGVGARDMWGARPDDVWAVGDRGTILRFDGKGWAHYESGTLSQLSGLFGTARDDVYAVGYNIVLHWDGSSWLDEGVPSNLLQGALWAVWVSPQGTVWASGQNDVVLRKPRNGAWQAETLPGTSNQADGYEDIYGSSDDDLWAVSDDGVVHHTASGWTATNLGLTHQTGGPSEGLWSVWGPGDGTYYAVGPGGVLATLDGTTWTVTRPFAVEEMWHVWGSGPADVWAASPSSTWRKQGTGWRRVPGRFGTSSLQSGVTLDAGVSLQMGDNGMWAVVSADGGGFTNYRDMTGPDLTSLFVIDGQRVLAGAEGSWYERQMQGGRPAWVQRACNTSAPTVLRSLWGSPSGKVWATTQTNLAVAFTFGADGCAELPVPFDAGVVAGIANGPVMFTGLNGSVMLPNETASAFASVPMVGGAQPTASWGGPGGTFLAVTDGDGGILTGTSVAGWSWLRQPMAGKPLAAVQGSGTQVWVAGLDGNVLKGSGTWPALSFLLPPNGDRGEPLTGLAVLAPDDVWVAGYYGGAWHHPGSSQDWDAYPLPLLGHVSVAGSADAGVWAFGGYGWNTYGIVWHP